MELPAHRSALDLVVLALTVTVCSVLIFMAFGVVILELVHPDYDTSDMIRLETELLGVMVGALVGFLGGRGYRVVVNQKEKPNASGQVHQEG